MARVVMTRPRDEFPKRKHPRKEALWSLPTLAELRCSPLDEDVEIAFGGHELSEFIRDIGRR